MSLGAVLLAGALARGGEDGKLPAFPVTIAVDAGQTRGEVRPIWRFFGADEPNYAARTICSAPATGPRR